jgi:hypothetical protein
MYYFTKKMFKNAERNYIQENKKYSDIFKLFSNKLSKSSFIKK